MGFGGKTHQQHGGVQGLSSSGLLHPVLQSGTLHSNGGLGGGGGTGATIVGCTLAHGAGGGGGVGGTGTGGSGPLGGRGGPGFNGTGHGHGIGNGFNGVGGTNGNGNGSSNSGGGIGGNSDGGVTGGQRKTASNMEDLIHLPGPLTEDAVMRTLQTRFNEGKFFVSTREGAVSFFYGFSFISECNAIENSAQSVRWP